jgi:chloride channel 3/4/5
MSSPTSVTSLLPSGPPVTGLLSGPSDTDSRRQRLQQIGNYPIQNHADEVPRETTALHAALNGTSYGTMPAVRSRRAVSNGRPSRSLSALSGLPQTRSATFSGLEIPSSPKSLRETFRRRISQRPISAYDAPLANTNTTETDLDVQTNGFRVWYSSFSSIDWLHDTIKDSVRFARLRRGKSIRSRVQLAFDKSIGWIIVTVVGSLTAIVAFLVVRGEQWLFDVKEGYCTTAWWHAQQFCCPQLEEYAPSENSLCPAWRTWSDVFVSWVHSESGNDQVVVQYVMYTIIAVCFPVIFGFGHLTCPQVLLASTSSLLTIYLTASTSFVTRKESGVLSPESDKNGEQNQSSPLQPNRKELYYVCISFAIDIRGV